MTHEFLFDNFNDILLLTFFFHSKTHVSNLMNFQKEMVHFFLKNEALRSESVNGISEQNNETVSDVPLIENNTIA